MMWLYLPEVPWGTASVDLVGGKAMGICWLQSRGFRVPPTWVLTTQAFDAAVRAAGLTGHIAALESVTANRPDWVSTELALRGVEDVRLEIVEALRTGPLPEAAAAALGDLPQDEEQWAVRSSATVEDAGSHSFAGQFKSFLSVPRGPQLAEAVREVWASTFEPNVLHYRAQHDTPMPRMAVLLQPMEPITLADRAGVAFSQSTVPGLAGVLLQSTFGAGLTVVSGGGGELKSVREREVTTQPVPTPHALVTAADGGVQPVPVPPGAVLSDPEAYQLADLVRKIARQYGRPADVEFVWRRGEDPLFVQVRTITALPGPPTG